MHPILTVGLGGAAGSLPRAGVGSLVRNAFTPDLRLPPGAGLPGGFTTLVRWVP